MYISKIQHYNDGMLTTDSEIINVIRTHNRDYTMLFNMEKLSVCSNLVEGMREEKIIQLEADRADSNCQFEDKLAQKNIEIEREIITKEQLQNQKKMDDSAQYAGKIQQIQTKKKKADKDINDLVAMVDS